MFNFFQSFRDHEDGAVTVDWVVLTAAIAFLSVGILFTISQAATNNATSVGAVLSSREIINN